MEIETLVKRVQAALGPDTEVFVRDLTGQANHFEGFVVSDAFAGKGLLERQRLVMASVSDLLNGPLHAFTFKTYTKEDWSKAHEL